MSGPRVLYIIDSLAPGGAERSVAEVASHLIDAGIVLDIAVLHDRAGFADDIRAAGATITMVGGDSRPSWSRNLVRLMRDRRPDLVHTTLYDADQVGRIAAAIARIPVVSSLVTVSWGPEQMSESNVPRAKVEMARLLDVVTARLVRRFHAVSNTVATEVAPRLHIRRHRIEVIRRGRDPVRLGRRSPERRAAARHTLGIDGPALALVTLARHEPPKRLDVLIGAMTAVRAAHPDARLLVAGREGRETAQLQQLIETHHLEDAVTLLGPYDNVPDLLCAADMFVLPTMREGLPGSIVEALALETPIVASDIPAVREVVDESTAVLVPIGTPEELAAAIVATLADPAGMAARAAAGRAVFEAEFTIDVSARKWVDFYRSVV